MGFCNLGSVGIRIASLIVAAVAWQGMGARDMRGGGSRMMLCPVCGGKSWVKSVKTDREMNEVRRRRECVKCGCRFWTMELEMGASKNGEGKYE